MLVGMGDEDAPREALQYDNILFDRRSSGSTPDYDFAASVRKMAEQSIELIRSAVSRIIENTQETTHNMQVSKGTGTIPTIAALPLGIELWEQNTAAAFALARNVVRA